jgi:trk system potassium uptake protein
MLKKGQIEESDALVASTGLDSINTVIAMLGSMMGVEKIIVRLVSVALEPACRQIGVTSIVTPTVSAAAEMISTRYGFHRVNFSSVASGGLELEMLRLSEDRHIKVSELDIPDGSNLVAVMRGDQMLLPRPNLRLEGGEELMLLVEDRRVVEPLRRQLDSED